VWNTQTHSTNPCSKPVGRSRLGLIRVGPEGGGDHIILRGGGYIFIYLSIYLYLSISIYLYLSISIYIYLSLSLSLSISIYLYLSLYLSILLSLSIYLSTPPPPQNYVTPPMSTSKNSFVKTPLAPGLGLGPHLSHIS
jgi:hypothetical protein